MVVGRRDEPENKYPCDMFIKDGTLYVWDDSRLRAHEQMRSWKKTGRRTLSSVGPLLSGVADLYHIPS